MKSNVVLYHGAVITIAFSFLIIFGFVFWFMFEFEFVKINVLLTIYVWIFDLYCSIKYILCRRIITLIYTAEELGNFKR